MLLRRARHLSLLPILGAVGATTGFVACGHSTGTGTTAGEPSGSFESLTTQTSESIVASTSGQAPATPFTESGGVLRSANVVRSIALSGDAVVGQWGGRQGPDTRTTRVAVAGSDVGLPEKWAIDGAGVVRSAGGVTERIAPTSVGYRRSWTFTSAPAQGAPIVASIAASADSVVSIDGSGLHVMRSGTRFHIGSATWIDAGGAQTAIAPTYDRGQLTYAVPADVVGRSAFPAVLDPDVGPEFLVPPTQNINPWLYVNDPTLSSVSVFPLDSGGVGVVVASSSTPYWGSGDLLDIYAPAATATGLTLQTSKPFPGPPPVQTGGGSTGCSGPGCPAPPAPASAPCGSDECLAWAYLSSTGTVYVQRFDRTTWTWYDANPVSVTNALTDSPKTSATPQIVTNGAQYLVCWLDTGANDVHCSTRQGSSLAAVGSTVSVAGPAAVTSFAAAGTTGAFGVLVPGAVASDGGISAAAAVTTISSTGVAASPVSLPTSIGVSPALVGESGGNFLVAGSAQLTNLPAFIPGGGGPGGGGADAAVPGYTGGLLQRVTAAGALSGAPFSAGAAFGVYVLGKLCSGGGSGISLADAGLLAVPGRGTLGWSGASGSPQTYPATGTAFCKQFSQATYTSGITYDLLPPFFQAASGPLADGGLVRGDPDGGACAALDAGALGAAALPDFCYDTPGGGLGAFVSPSYSDAGPTNGYYPAGYFNGFGAFEVTPGATTASPHPEINGTVPSALSGIQNGFVSSATTAPYGGCFGSGCGRITSSIQSTLYDAGSGMYVPTGTPIPFFAYADRRTALHGSYDSTSQSYFAGWFQEGSTPLAEAGTASLPDAAIYVNVYADPGGAAEAGTTAKAAPVAISPPATFTFAPATSSGCLGCLSSSGSLDTEPIWSMDAALQTALVSYVGLKSNGTTALIGQLINSNGALKGTYGALASVTGVTGLRTCHSLTQYFVSYLTNSSGSGTGGWATVAVDPTQSSITPVAEAAGSPVPFANSVGSVMPAYLTVTSGSTTTTHVGLVSVSSPTTQVKDFDVDIANWSPAPPNVASGGSNGGYYGYLDVYTGTDDVIVTYPVQSGSNFVAYCARINATTGAYIDSHLCTPPSGGTNCLGGTGGFCSFGGSGSPGVGDAAEKLLSINTGASTVQRWFVEPWGYGETPDLPFPAPTRAFASTNAIFSWDTSTQATIVGGSANALALYFGIWTQADGMVERDLYARWIRPGYVGSQTCASNDECDTNQCVSGQCVAATAPPPPDAGSGSSSGGVGGDSGTSSGGSTSGSSSGSGGLDATASSSGGSNGGSSGGSSSGSGTSSSGGSSSSSGATSDSGTGSSSGSAGGGDSGTGSSSGGASSSGAGTSSGGTSSGATGGDASATNDSGTPGSSGSVGSSSGSSGASGDDGGLGAFDGGPTVMSKGASGSKGGCGCVTVGTEGTGSHRGDAGAIFGMAVAAALVRRRRR